MNIVDHDATYAWLRNSNLKRETEALIMAAQEQSLRTNSIRAKIDRTIDSDKCRMCKQLQETSEHLVSGCSKLAQKEYKRRHDKIATLIHWNILKEKGFPTEQQWYNHQPNTVTESATTKILWDFNIQTDKVIEARRPDILVPDKINKAATIIDIAVPTDRNVKDKQDEKIDKYQELAFELKRLWKLVQLPRVVPVVIGALGAIPHGHKKHLTQIGMGDKWTQAAIQKAAILGTARILRKVLSLPGDR